MSTNRHLEGNLPICVESCQTHALDTGNLDELIKKLPYGVSHY